MLPSGQLPPDSYNPITMVLTLVGRRGFAVVGYGGRGLLLRDMVGGVCCCGIWWEGFCC